MLPIERSRTYHPSLSPRTFRCLNCGSGFLCLSLTTNITIATQRVYLAKFSKSDMPLYYFPSGSSVNLISKYKLSSSQLHHNHIYLDLSPAASIPPI